jgi:CHC2 zinc finger
MGLTINRSQLSVPSIFYEQHGHKWNRPNRRGYVMTNPTFCHPSKSGRSFSYQADNGSFRCFGCGIHGGDVIDYLRLKNGWSFKEAASSLGLLRELSDNERAQAEQKRLARQRETEEQTRVREQDRKLRFAIREEIFSLVAAQRTADERLTELRQGAIPAYAAEDEDCWQILAHVHDEVREAEEQYQLACGVWPE